MDRIRWPSHTDTHTRTHANMQTSTFKHTYIINTQWRNISCCVYTIFYYTFQPPPTSTGT